MMINRASSVDPMIFTLLKKVARTFYLTIWWLPHKLRSSVGLAYLLARLSDTIADEGELGFLEREKILENFKNGAEGRADSFFLWDEKKSWQSFSSKEKDLLEHAPKILSLLQSRKYQPSEIDLIKNLWLKVLEGQLMDLRYQRLEKFFSSQDLENYLYLVAGSVGEFLTQMMVESFPKFSKAPLDMMQAWAIDYGKGLQLVNILRDFSSDRKQGRFYFEMEKWDQYHAQAMACFQHAEAYVKALRPGRFKMASALPWLLGKQTLHLLENSHRAEKLKISRCRVYVTLLKALRFLFW